MTTGRRATAPTLRDLGQLRRSPWASFGQSDAPRHGAATTDDDEATRDDEQLPTSDRDVEVPEGALRVVMVDDDLRIRTLARMLLERSDDARIIAEASDGDQVPDLLETVQPDVVLLDLLMPKVDGRAVLPQIVREAPETMVLVLSALSGTDEADRTFALGAFAYLEKSVVGPELPNQIRELHGLFQRALAGETVWSPAGPPRVRR